MICTGMLISCFLLALPDFFQFFFGQIILLVNITHQPRHFFFIRFFKYPADKFIRNLIGFIQNFLPGFCNPPPVYFFGLSDPQNV